MSITKIVVAKFLVACSSLKIKATFVALIFLPCYLGPPKIKIIFG